MRRSPVPSSTAASHPSISRFSVSPKAAATICTVSVRRPRRLVPLRQSLGQKVGLAADGAEAAFVVEGAVVGHLEKTVALPVDADFGDEDLHFIGFDFVGEDVAQGLGEGVGQALGRHVRSPVHISLEIGMPDSGHPQSLEFVVLADTGKSYPVVDLTDLVEGAARILSKQQDPVGVLHRDNRSSPGNALPGIFGPVLDQLFGRYVERHAHRMASIAVAEIAATRSSSTSR